VTLYQGIKGFWVRIGVGDGAERDRYQRQDEEEEHFQGETENIKVR
jgi:hypothetical protein